MKARLRLSWSSGNSLHSLEVEEGQRLSSEGMIAGLSVSQDKDSAAYVYSVYLFASHELELKSLALDIPFRFSDTDCFLSNGYQSWSETREYAMHEKQQRLVPVLRNQTGRSGDYAFVPYGREKGEFHSHLFTRIRSENAMPWYFLSLNERDAYTVFRSLPGQEVLRAEKDVAGLVFSAELRPCEIMMFQGDDEKMKTAWRKGLQIQPPRAGKSCGWTSWYNYYTHIDESIILKNLQYVSDAKDWAPGFFQVDDGWQSAVGDWQQVNAKFPRGMKFIADEIRNTGMKPGIWWAPFICEHDSEIFRKHRDWLLTADGEHLVEGGYNPGWSGKYFILDLYHPQVRQYLRACAKTLLDDWGFELIKSDFLFASAWWPRKGKSRGRIMHESMQFLREICGDKIILGCGVPLGAAMGWVDYCRIGPDVGLHWDMKSLAALHVAERVSTKNAIRNTILRSVMDGVGFCNDPDVFILRNENQHLTSGQKNCLYRVNQLFGSLLFSSDDFSMYPPEIRALLKNPASSAAPRLISLEYLSEQQFRIRYSQEGKEETLLFDAG